MKVWQSTSGGPPAGAHPGCQLVLVFGPRQGLTAQAIAPIQAAFPEAVVAGCSGAGEIAGQSVSDDATIVTAIRFDHTRVAASSIALEPDEDSTGAGARLVAALAHEGLAHVFVLSDGLHVNGTALVDGMLHALPAGVSVTGGLAGDGSRFQETRVVSGSDAQSRRIVAIGLYGDRLEVGYGSLGGWDPFGPVRRITRSEGNVLFTLDDRPALELYKEYLGEHAVGLPATGLLFPLYLPREPEGVVRTILGVDEEARSMTFAGDMPQGAMAQLMKANFDRLVDGAEAAAQRSKRLLSGPAELALLVSCVGRRLVLKQRVEDELDAVRQVVGEDATLVGFYSYGEICPAAPDAACQLHNQTMTVTALRET